MFTGLVEAVGYVAALDDATAGLRLRIRTSLASDLEPGESVAVNGACLTVAAASDGEMHAHVGPETVRVTTLGTLVQGQPVNLERALRAGSRLGGHFVQGHVDGTGRVDAVESDGDSRWLTIGYPGNLARFLVEKGSVAVDGISLTVARLGETQFTVMIVPYTWLHTHLSSLCEGSLVNLECDIIGKYVARAVDAWETGAARPLTNGHR
jgi:riboflavin synthase